MIQNLINHIVFVLDQSTSMSKHSGNVVKVFDDQIQYLARKSKELNQETRVSVYVFADNVRNLIFDMDVMRTPSLKGHYSPNGNTALIDSTIKAIDDHKLIPQMYGDSSFLVYVLTDGEENRGGVPSSLNGLISNLADNWTVACLVPNSIAVHNAKKAGFSAQNISVWDSESSNGIEEAGSVIRSSTDAYMANRSKGIRSTKTLFSLKTDVSIKDLDKKLSEISPTNYDLFPVHNDSVIKDFVESWTKRPYVNGSTYYLLSKPEKIQGHKQIAIQNKLNGKVFSGSNARKMLGLPDYEVKVNPANFNDFDVFVQSTSLNRKLIRGTKCIVMK